MEANQEKTPLFDAIMKYIALQPAYFRIPGHRFERGINPKWREFAGENIFKMDLTETPFLDDLHNPSGAIKEAEILAEKVFGAKRTFFLVNGTTCGNEAMIVAAAFNGEKIIIPRNAHKSALMGLIIGGARPVYIMPRLSEEWGVHGGIDPSDLEETLKKNPDAKGVFAVSPTYYGLCSDIKALADICRRYGIPLIVDEAHGAHLYFSDMLPEGAMNLGADACAQSIHKVAGSLTQSSMLHINHNSLIDEERIEANLHLVQSTSPSYILMTSLDMARHELATRGREQITKAVELADYIRKEVNNIEGMKCLGEDIIGTAAIKDLDKTRLTISAREIGITGFELKRILFEEFSIDVELSDWMNVLAVVTFANEREDAERLVAALKAITLKYGKSSVIRYETAIPSVPPYVLSPREAYFSPNEKVGWRDAKGRIAAEMIAPYPPGIPVIYPGERVTDEVWEYIERFRIEKRHLQGMSDPHLNTFKVISQKAIGR